jgi:hypothetical protein
VSCIEGIAIFTVVLSSKVLPGRLTASKLGTAGAGLPAELGTGAGYGWFDVEAAETAAPALPERD